MEVLMSPIIAKRYGNASDSLHLGRICEPSGLLTLTDNRRMETASDRRKRRLQALCDLHTVNEVAARAGLNPDNLRQVLNGILLPPKADGTRSARALGNAAARQIERSFSLGDGWFDQAGENTVGSSRQLADSVDKAHSMSLLGARMPPPTVRSWGGLMTADLSAAFEVALEDDAMAPDFRAGTIIRFDPHRTPAYGKHVLLRDRRGQFHFRKFAQSATEEWEGRAKDDAFRTITPGQDGATVVAVMKGYYVEED
jgi:hypothetical protein